MRYILLKHSASACNKELVDFLIRNKKRINSTEKLVVVIVYDALIDKLQGKITNLPVLITNGVVITGTSTIISSLSDKKIQQPTPTTSIAEFWKSEMTSTEDNAETNEMDAAKDKAYTTMGHRAKSMKDAHKNPSNIKASVSSYNNTNVTVNENIGSMDSDPIMKKFWDNQEYTPGV